MNKSQVTRHKSQITNWVCVGCDLSLVTCALCLALVAGSCASVPTATPPATPTVQPPSVSWEDKLGWILRLEDQRLLRDPNPPPPVVLVPATKTQPAIVAPPAPSDLIRLLSDGEARV